MLIILEQAVFAGGGINFDAKIRRNSTDLADFFHAHIGGIDTFARALIVRIMCCSNLSIRRSARSVTLL